QAPDVPPRSLHDALPISRALDAARPGGHLLLPRPGGAAARPAPELHVVPALVRPAQTSRAGGARRAGRRDRDHGGHGLMGVWSDLYNGDTHFGFPKWWRRALVLSAVLIVVSIVSFAVRGLNLGIDFEGGTSWE